MKNQENKFAFPADIQIIFVLARGRSGTTLLQTILDSHPNIQAPFESRFAIHYRHRYLGIKKWTTNKKNKFIGDVLKEMKISLFWEINIHQLKERIHKLPENSNYGLLCKQVYLSRISFFKKEKIEFIIDKNPIHSVLIPLIISIFPKAKFIHVVRDFRANSNSYLNFYPLKKMRELGNMWLAYNQKIEIFKSKNTHLFYTIVYEDLVTRPENNLKQLLLFFGLKYYDSMLFYYQTINNQFDLYLKRAPNLHIRKMRELGMLIAHKNLTKPLNPKLIDSWKQKLSSNQIKELDFICGAYSTRYGYKNNHLNLPKKEVPFDLKIRVEKLLWYYSLPIWFRELKSKPKLDLLPTK